MNFLVLNCGSSTIKAEVLEPKTGTRHVELAVERLGSGGATYRIGDDEPRPCDAQDHATALEQVLPQMLARFTGELSGVGHRVVHGAERFQAPVRVDDEVEAAIEALVPLAPLHNPANLAGIRAARRLLPDLPHVAVFDTAFHATLPPRARTYALDMELAHKHGLRRYGFHGSSHAFVSAEAAAYLQEDPRALRIITCHLGNGCSMAAVEYGRSVETSMGMTPLEGLVMGTRSGDVDPGVLLTLLRNESLDADALDALLNKTSGLRGLSGVGNDMRDIEERAAQGDDRARMAIHVFTHRIRKYLGAYAAVMGGVEAVVFTGGIGENSALVRHRVCQRLDFLGARLDEDRNRFVSLTDAAPVAEISEPHSRVKLLVVATDEQRYIAEQVAELVQENDRVESALTIPVAISARHVHLTDEAVEALYGPGHTLTPRTELNQPGQFACEETVTLVGSKRKLERVRVIGPTRSRVQVEISRSDEFHLGIDAPVRRSGDLDNTPGILLVGPAGELRIEEGVICSRRHIHMTPDDAARFGVDHLDTVAVAIDSDGRDLVFEDVVVRVKDSYRLEMHVDTDEGNAAELNSGDAGVLHTTGRVAKLQRREVGPLSHPKK